MSDVTTDETTDVNTDETVDETITTDNSTVETVTSQDILDAAANNLKLSQQNLIDIKTVTSDAQTAQSNILNAAVEKIGNLEKAATDNIDTTKETVVNQAITSLNDITGKSEETVSSVADRAITELKTHSGTIATQLSNVSNIMGSINNVCDSIVENMPSLEVATQSVKTMNQMLSNFDTELSSQIGGAIGPLVADAIDKSTDKMGESFKDKVAQLATDALSNYIDVAKMETRIASIEDTMDSVKESVLNIKQAATFIEDAATTVSNFVPSINGLTETVEQQAQANTESIDAISKNVYVAIAIIALAVFIVWRKS